VNSKIVFCIQLSIIKCEIYPDFLPNWHGNMAYKYPHLMKVYKFPKKVYFLGMEVYKILREVYFLGKEVYKFFREVYFFGVEVYKFLREVYFLGVEVYKSFKEVYKPLKDLVLYIC